MNSRKYILLILIFNYITISAISSAENLVTKIEKYEIDFSKVAKEIIAPQGIGSSLAFKEQKNNKLYFYALTDRGPNFEGPDTLSGEETIIFSSPEFKPYIGLIEVSSLNKTAEVVAATTLFDADNKEINGIFKHRVKYGGDVFLPLNKNYEVIKQDKHGFDSEALGVEADGSFWVGEEYSVSLSHFSKEGKLIKKYEAGKELPAILNKYATNRGIESLSITKSGKVVFIMESTLDLGQDREHTNFVRVISFNPKDETSKMYIYPFDKNFYKAKSFKIGDMDAIDEDRFVVIEQGKEKNGKMHNRLFIMDLKGASDITNIDPEIADNLEFKTHQQLHKIKAINKEFMLDLREQGWDLEKAEGIAIIAPNKIAITNDNDFGIEAKLTSKDKGKIAFADCRLDLASKKIFYQNSTKAEDVTLAVQNTAEKSHLWIIEFNKPLIQ